MFKMQNKQQFPPIGWLWKDYAKAMAWYSGDPAQIAKAEAGEIGDRFWASKEDIKLHVPIAADIASLSASMIFSDSPAITCKHERTSERIEEIFTKSGAYSVLLQAAELCSVCGGVFLKLSWDVSDGRPILSAVPADCGLPKWKGDRVHEIKLWSIVREDENTGYTWRLQETYTADGHIRAELFRGTSAELGDAYPLTAIPETEDVSPDANSGTGMMLAFYVPNMLPNRNRPHTRFGRSDFDSLYGLMDALDEAYSAMQRETRMTKTTVIVPAEYLAKRQSIFGPNSPYSKGDQWVYANNSGAFTALDIDSGLNSNPITVVNPEMRADSRIAVCDDLIKRIFSVAGYAPQSAGIDVQGSAESGTALSVRERKTIRTSETKKTHWWHAVNDIVRAMLKLDSVVFRSGVDPNAEFSVELPSNTQPDIGQLAEILEQLERAGAVSVETKVAILHPDWDEEKRAEEVARIRRDHGASEMDDLNNIINENEPPEGGEE